MMTTSTIFDEKIDSVENGYQSIAQTIFPALLIAYSCGESS
jgi:hypothetical protein